MVFVIHEPYMMVRYGSILEDGNVNNGTEAITGALLAG